MNYRNDFSDQACESPVHIYKRWLPTKTTPIFDAYWRFAAERQSIFFKRFFREAGPYTEDDTLKTYKFTNAYRASDRTSQFLIKNVIYSGREEHEEVFFRIILFKIFNKIQTWKTLEQKLGVIEFRKFNIDEYDSILSDEMRRKVSIFSCAYIMPTRTRDIHASKKHLNYLKILKMMMDDKLPSKLCKAKNMQTVFRLLREYPLIGDFLAYQYAIDINYSEITNFDEMSFVVPGPGAIDGLKKCFSDPGGLSPVDLITLMAERQEEEFDRLGLDFQSLWGRPLQLIDCQNLFCEIDKYSRVNFPEYKGMSGRKRIKQKFNENTDKINFFYPPKWNINAFIKV